ncbi:non-ribosomal peptide synthetase [Pseudomonas sessilinigenes]|uniref:Amino acid adenylation domain-containing protein n=1 Tax=Pseudomonas sessilinigenes TaxID=658629 RepID=A0ABX8MW03_9PSED|nr:non-ribosomal peptide synthetase [Pseudomonas sessilinigenes]AZC24462.1 Long-chain-fatty-acid--CoA ligase [Pseudomonas sessilinigenes]QXH43398.1 amino acid adenylation domain-containing protein [Pseudomonas sessilinigenes]
MSDQLNPTVNPQSSSAKVQAADIYPLTFLQEGLLFHSLQDGAECDYLVQVSCRLDGVDAQRWREAWERVVAGVDVLKTAFAWRNVSPPMQIVTRDVALQWTVVDCSHQEHAEQECVFEAYLERDRASRFNLSRPPLHRMAVFLLGNGGLRFVWTYHHLILDAWSATILLGWVMDAYLTGKPVPAKPFKAYVGWVQKRNTQQAREFWRTVFAEPAPLSSPPFLQPQALAVERQPRRLQRLLSEADTRRLSEAVAARRLTLATLIQGAWALTLRDFSLCEDVTFGWVVADRSADLQGVDNMVGLMVNTVPVRLPCDPDTTADRFLQQVQASSTLAWDNGRLPLTEIHDIAGLSAGEALFETVVVFENLPPLQEGGAHGISVQDRRAFWRTSYPISLMVAPHSCLKLEIAYNAAQVEEGTVAALLERMEAYALALAIHAQRPIGELLESQAAVCWEGPPQVLGPRSLGAQLLERLAARGASMALHWGTDAGLQADQLVRSSRALADQLRVLGLKPGHLVATHLERDASQVVALLALLEVGCPFLAIDRCLPLERKHYLLADSGAGLIIGPADDRLPDCEAQRLELDAWGRLIAAPALAVSSVLLDERAAYLMYTSGSTGQPKGVVVPVEALENLLISFTQVPGLTARDRFLALTTLSFDISLLEVLGPLWSGALLLLAPSEVGRDPQRLAQLIARTEPTVMQATPALWRLLLQAGWAGAEHLRAWCGGEALDRSLAQLLLARVAQLWNVYGPTETTIWALVQRIGAQDPEIYLGTPVNNMRAYVLDTRGRHVPLGGRGRLFLAGRGLALGYHRRQAATEAAFVADPFAAGTGELMYNTGDTVQVTAQGHLRYLGRSDGQFKLRGIRMELAEIEAALYRHPAVLAAAAKLWPDGEGGHDLVGYVVCSSPVEQEAIRAVAAGVLPPGTAPAHIVVMDRLPLSPAGKVERKLLPSPVHGARASSGRPHRSALSEVVEATWNKVLGVRGVAQDDDFFALGGHSLKVVAVTSLLNRQFGTSIALVELFRAPTLRAYAARVEQLVSEHAGGLRPAPSVVDRTVWRGLSSSQRQLWFISHADKARRAFQLTCALQIDGPLDVQLLSRAVDLLQQQHGALRTLFRESAGAPQQRVLPGPQRELETWAVAEIEPALAQLAREPLALDQGPPLRFVLLRESALSSVCALVVHHLLVDEWSLGILVEDLSALYSALESGTEVVPQPQARLDFLDYVADEIEQAGTPQRRADLDYWLGQLRQLRPTRLSADRHCQASPGFRGGHLRLELDASLRGHLERVAAARAMTPFVALLAGFYIVLQRYGVGDDICLGVMDAGRTQPEMERVVGLFARALPVRLQIDEGEPLEGLMRRLQATLLEASIHASAPLDEMVRELDMVAERGRNPLFNILIVMQNMMGGATTFGGLPARPVAVDSGVSEFDLLVEIFASDHGYGVRLVYDSERFEAGRMGEFAARLERTLLQIADNPLAQVGDISLLEPGEAESMRRAFAAETP